MSGQHEIKPKKPEWLKVRANYGGKTMEVEKLLERLHLNTVCDAAACPNRGECFNRKTATFMILGNICTRNCRFCNVTKGDVEAVDISEPEHVAQAVKELGLRHVVITSVTRDDLGDGGAGHFAQVIKNIRATTPEVTIEVLIPDFQGNLQALKTVVDAQPEIINHNMETVPSLYQSVRPMAIYERSLELLKRVKTMNPAMLTKSGIMVGLGESEEEVVQVMKDLKACDCDILTVGQYLAPTKMHYPMAAYIHPDVFEHYKTTALQLGFKYVASAPLVRSSYLADEALIAIEKRNIRGAK